ncbi:CIC11C00000004038 [Sungouiella intermedia]|uniref:CIC11C00000004038 n=1 Tax=Sungouiella intermedia TaxID=45354 RepID=A0A1L0BX61_9ASCO|nr:CIC11C00000004038 [[Candida] intermedia]
MTTFREQMKGFPFWQMAVVMIIRFSEPISFTSLFPYVYFMVRDFKIAKDPSQISRFTGYLAASFALAQFLCCIHWGRLSDRIGRKYVLLCGLLGSALSLTIFGFSRNFYMALAARTTAGALNGNIAVLQTMVGEIATQRQHQSIAFSTLPLLWNVGCVIGPLIGGSKYLTRPKGNVDATSLDSYYENFLNHHPYALSNIVVALCLCCSALMGFLFLEETHYRAKKRYDIGLATGDWIRSKLGFTIPLRPWETRTKPLTKSAPVVDTAVLDDDDYDSLDENTPLASDPVPIYGDEQNDNESISSLGPFTLTRRSSLAISRRYSQAYSLQPVILTVSGASVNEETKSLFKAFRNRNIFTNKVIGTVWCYFMISFHCLIFTEFLPVFLAGQIRRDKLQFPWRILGGFGWDTQEIGTLLSSTGFVGCFIIIFVFPFLDKHVKTINGFRFACFMFPISYVLVPYSIFTIPEYSPWLPSWTTTVALYACTAISVLGSSLAFPQISILVYRATKPRHRAFVNASAMSATSLARFLAPLSWGALISYFDGQGVSQMSWILLAFMACITLTLALNLDEYDEDLAEAESVSV